jgi:hypothetical protein
MIRQIVPILASFDIAPYGERAVDPRDAFLPADRPREAPGRLRWPSQTIHQSRRPRVAATHIASVASKPDPPSAAGAGRDLESMIRQIVPKPGSSGTAPYGERAVDPRDAFLRPDRPREASGRFHSPSRTINKSRRPLVPATHIASVAPIPNPHPLPGLEEIWNES